MSKPASPQPENSLAGAGGANTLDEMRKAKPLRPANGEETLTYQAQSTGAATKPTATAKPLPTALPSGLRAEWEEAHEQGTFWVLARAFMKASPAWLTSMLLHFAMLLVLALVVVPLPPAEIVSELVAKTLGDETELVEDLTTEELQEVEITDAPLDFSQQVYSDTVGQTLEAANNLDTSAAAVQVEMSDFNEIQVLKTDLLKTIGAVGGTDLSGRGNEATRQQMVVEGGGNEASEAAVAMALNWLARQQLPDGGWDFSSPGSGGALREARNGATGMALLPMLGAGQTQKEGKYKEVVRSGLFYLISHEKQNGSLVDRGNMYSHGIATLALAEAYAMTQERQLHPPAQAALNFIVSAQDRIGGGWRYTPGQAGDTSVVGWQLMALKSGNMGYLAVNPQTIKGVEHFLNTVQTNSGANYGYTGPGAGKATSAVGLLCRMYLGWKKDHPGLEKGVEYLSKTGPDKQNMYYSYYATQVLHHYEGEPWRKWNEEMRNYLVNSQEKNGPNRGSWQFNPNADHGASHGGRLYCTAMACMTLEVYYRHLPIYRKQAAETEFEGP
jgi:hypothetical protein